MSCSPPFALSADNGDMVTEQKRRPAGAPASAGGQFDKNDHAEADGPLGEQERSVPAALSRVEDLHGPFDDYAHVPEGYSVYTGKHLGVVAEYYLSPDGRIVGRSEHHRRGVLTYRGDRLKGGTPVPDTFSLFLSRGERAVSVNGQNYVVTREGSDRIALRDAERNVFLTVHRDADPEKVIRRVVEREHDFSFARPERVDAKRIPKGAGITAGEARWLAGEVAGESPDFVTNRLFSQHGRGSGHTLIVSLAEIARIRKSGWERDGSNPFEHSLDRLEDFYRQQVAR